MKNTSFGIRTFLSLTKKPKAAQLENRSPPGSNILTSPWVDATVRTSVRCTNTRRYDAPCCPQHHHRRRYHSGRSPVFRSDPRFAHQATASGRSETPPSLRNRGRFEHERTHHARPTSDCCR